MNAVLTTVNERFTTTSKPYDHNTSLRRKQLQYDSNIVKIINRYKIDI